MGSSPARRPRPRPQSRRGSRPRPRIVIVGAGFAGLAAARHLGREHAVTVIDPTPWFEWLPNIHELLSGVKRPADLRLPRRRLVTRAGHRFVRAAASEIDAGSGRVMTSDDRRFEFDACIVATGGVNETFGVRGAGQHALPFKSVDDCAAIGRRLTALAKATGRKSVVIVGGGLEGIEALGEILRRYRQIDGLGITVVEAGPRLLPGAPAALDAAVRKHCADLAVRFVTGSPVNAITRTQVQLGSGEKLRSNLTIWTGGVAPPRLLLDSGLADEPGQWAPVTRELLSRRFENVFVAGDAARLPRPLAKQAYYALQMGACAADNAARLLAGRRLRDFKPSAKPMLIAFGDLDTFLVSGRSVVASPALAAAKEAVFQVTMAQLDPPLAPKALLGASARLTGTAWNLALPTLLSADARGRLLRARRLASPPRGDD
jgi:NADH dehydrogenase FAD-containing subunit